MCIIQQSSVCILTGSVKTASNWECIMKRPVQPLRILAVLIALLVVELLSYKRIALAQPTAYPLLQQADLTYQGAFRLPAGTFGSSSFYYGGTALTYNPSNGSLFLVGHPWDQKVAEVNIPKIIHSAQLSSLTTAPILQPFTDASEGKMYTVDDGSIRVGGLMVSNGKLYGTVYSYYDGDGSQLRSHYYSSLNLSIQGDVQGMYQVGNLGAGFVSGYMTAIPAEWQAILGGPMLTGQCCLAIIGRTSSGPAVFVFDPNDLGVKNPVPASPLVYYPLTNPLGNWGTTNPYYNGSTEVTGMLFPQGTRSILFFGRHGLGTFCYGTGQECNDPTDSSKGTHAYPYAYQIWAYDAAELLKVKHGQLQPWQVRPYAIWNFDLPVPDQGKHIGGAAYDPQTRRIFLSQLCVDTDCLPVIHVFTVKNFSSDGMPPAAPIRLRFQ
jgi:hypothetical protein